MGSRTPVSQLCPCNDGVIAAAGAVTQKSPPGAAHHLKILTPAISASSRVGLVGNFAHCFDLAVHDHAVVRIRELAKTMGLQILIMNHHAAFGHASLTLSSSDGTCASGPNTLISKCDSFFSREWA